MLLVILGAGASYDSVAHLALDGKNYDERPPLADQLFADRPRFNKFINDYGECEAVVTALRNLQPG